MLLSGLVIIVVYLIVLWNSMRDDNKLEADTRRGLEINLRHYRDTVNGITDGTT